MINNLKITIMDMMQELFEDLVMDFFKDITLRTYLDENGNVLPNIYLSLAKDFNNWSELQIPTDEIGEIDEDSDEMEILINMAEEHLFW